MHDKKAPLLGLVLLANPTAQDWYVDASAPGCGTGRGTEAAPFCTVMGAVNAASSGDTIHIAPGKYLENLWLSKDLSLIGTFGQEVTILDGMAAGSVISVQDSQTKLSGLTIRNGLSGGGGGLSIDASLADASVVLTDCTVTQNVVLENCGLCTLSLGGGIRACSNAPYVASVILENTRVTDNTVINYLAFSEGYGGGVYVEGNLALTGSAIEGNGIAADAWAWGGGLYVRGSLTVMDSRVTGNVAEGMDAYGGGIVLVEGELALVDSHVLANEARARLGDGFAWGGGVLGLGNVLLANSTVAGNSATGYYSSGGGIHTEPSAHLTLTNATVSQNMADRGGALQLAEEAVVSNSIVWDNGPIPIHLLPGGSASIQFSLIEGGWGGTGNIGVDPMFVDPLDGDFRLGPTSPCIDAGNNLDVPLSITQDVRGAPRFLDDALSPDAGVGGPPTVDMGAYEFFRRLLYAPGAPKPAQRIGVR